MNEHTPGRPDARQPPSEGGVPDLAALDPTADPDRFDGIVSRIMEAARPELARRRELAAPLVYVSAWWRPALRAAAVIILVSAGLLVGFEHRAAGTAEVRGERTLRAELAAALGVPDALSGWVGGGEVPDPGELVLTLERER